VRDPLAMAHELNGSRKSSHTNLASCVGMNEQWKQVGRDLIMLCEPSHHGHEIRHRHKHGPFTAGERAAWRKKTKRWQRERERKKKQKKKHVKQTQENRKTET
jgi:hypothetical protein